MLKMIDTVRAQTGTGIVGTVAGTGTVPPLGGRGAA